MERRGSPRIEIKDADDYNMICDDMLTEWMKDWTMIDGMTREVDDDDWVDPDDFTYMHTQFAERMYQRACNRMRAVGLKYFDEEDLDIKNSSIIYP